MRGRKPLPTEVKLLRGNPGRRPLNFNEPKHAPLDAAEPVPECLTSADAREEWTRIVGTLSKGHVTVVDRSTLVGYCLKFGQWMDLEREAGKLPFLEKARGGGKTPNAYFLAANKAFVLMLKAATELGITPSSRARIVVKPTEDEGDEFTAYQHKRRQGA